MSKPAKSGEWMWGCWVEWEGGERGWAWCASDIVTEKLGSPFYYESFDRYRSNIMPLVHRWRDNDLIKRAVSRRVFIPYPEEVGDA